MDFDLEFPQAGAAAFAPRLEAFFELGSGDRIMLGQTHRAQVHQNKLLALILLVAPVIAGCSGPTAEDKLDAAFQNNPNAHRLEVAKFAGTVTIDNQAPGDEYKGLHILLVDADKYKDSNAPRWDATINSEGHFSFMTYLKDDGAPVGKYVVLFVDPRAKSNKRATASISKTASRSSTGADALKNLYNDPEVNVKDPQFVLDLQRPGTTEKTFDLKVAGKDGPSNPGNYAVTNVRAPSFQVAE
jgi:hypothetical protein